MSSSVYSRILFVSAAQSLAHMHSIAHITCCWFSLPSCLLSSNWIIHFIWVIARFVISISFFFKKEKIVKKIFFILYRNGGAVEQQVVSFANKRRSNPYSSLRLLLIGWKQSRWNPESLSLFLRFAIYFFIARSRVCLRIINSQIFKPNHTQKKTVIKFPIHFRRRWSWRRRFFFFFVSAMLLTITAVRVSVCRCVCVHLMTCQARKHLRPTIYLFFITAMKEKGRNIFSFRHSDAVDC